MTVTELIAELTGLPPEADVLIRIDTYANNPLRGVRHITERKRSRKHSQIDYVLLES